MDAISQILAAEVQDAHELPFGAGKRFALGEGISKTLEIFPTPGVVRITTDFAQIALYGVAEAQLSPEGIVIERDDLKLGITPRGEIALSISSHEAPATHSDLAHEEIPNDNKSAEQANSSKSEDAKERLALLGRVGATPSFRTTPKGILVGRFPLAIHEENNKTTWHTVLAFGERAEKLKESLTKGAQVEVVGYRHFREARMRDGRTKTVEEVYAVVVKSR